MEKKHWYDLPSSDRQNGRTFSIFFCFHKRYTFFFLSEIIWYFIFLFLVSSRISLLSLFILKNVTCIKHLCIETHLTLDVHKNTDIRIGMVKSSRNEIFPQLWSDKQIWECVWTPPYSRKVLYCIASWKYFWWSYFICVSLSTTEKDKFRSFFFI